MYDITQTHTMDMPSRTHRGCTLGVACQCCACGDRFIFSQVHGVPSERGGWEKHRSLVHQVFHLTVQRLARRTNDGARSSGRQRRHGCAERFGGRAGQLRQPGGRRTHVG